LLCFAAIFSAALLAQAPPKSPIEKLAPTDIARGKQLYDGHCVVCHAQAGTGAKGPRLAQPKLRHAPDDAALFEVIKDGIPGTEMPLSWQMTDREIWQLAGYVRSLGRTPPVSLPGDATRGHALFDKNGCGGCHIVNGVGNALGPELTDIGARRSAEYLRESIVKPGAQVPEQFVVVTATARDGKSIRGERVTEDSFTVQIRDMSGRVTSFRKSELTNYEKHFHDSLMPSYESKLSAAELNDLISYLASLRGAQ